MDRLGCACGKRSLHRPERLDRRGRRPDPTSGVPTRTETDCSTSTTRTRRSLGARTYTLTLTLNFALTFAVTFSKHDSPASIARTAGLCSARHLTCASRFRGHSHDELREISRDDRMDHLAGEIREQADNSQDPNRQLILTVTIQVMTQYPWEASEPASGDCSVPPAECFPRGRQRPR